MPSPKVLLALVACLWCVVAATQPPMVAQHITDLETLGGGGHSNDQQAIDDTLERCYANLTIPDSSSASVVGTVFAGTVYIAGVFFVDDDVLFQNAQVFMEAGAQIVVLGGFTLDIEVSSFTACSEFLWKSITAQDGSLVRIRASFMDDAESTIEALDGSTVWVNATQFHNNRVGIGIPDNGLAYNNVACWVGNSEFYSMGTLRLPYPGQTTPVGTKGFAAVEAHKTTLDFTGGNNIIHGMSNGIVAHKSYVVVNDCRFLDIHPDAVYDYAGNGAGIFARGSGFHSLKQTGYGMYSTPSFEGCRWGIYTEYNLSRPSGMNVKSTENNMLDMGTAYRVDYSGFMDVDILNNKVFTHFNGIDLRFNPGSSPGQAGALHVLVEGNDITFGDADCPLCRAYSAIFVSEGNLANDSSVIKGNTVHFLPVSQSRFGIALTAADDWLVAENTVLMADNATSFAGIHLNGCRRPEVSCNTITGASNTYPLDAQAAIRNMMGSDVLISCNEMDSTSNGILFNFVAPNTEVRGNFFHNHQWPLHLDTTAVIGGQLLKGNLWDPNVIDAPLIGAWYEADPLQAATNRFWYNPVTLGAEPPSWSPPNWFAFDPGTNYDCADDEDYCSQFRGRGKERLSELDVRVASDSLENDPYTAETKWILESDLYKKLDQNPELLDSIPVIADFFDALQGSTQAALKAIDHDQLALYHLDITLVVQLQLNSQELDELMDLVKEAWAQLGDSTLTATQRHALLTSISGYRQNIRDLSIWNSTTLQIASGTKALNADSVRTSNAGVATSETIQSNEKSVNEIYLATIGKDVDTLTADQAATLLDIAEQCPMLGGNAVFKARSLYWLFDDAQEFDDPALCLASGITVKRLSESVANATVVIPNPAVDAATLRLLQQLDGPSVFAVYDALGATVIRHTVPAETPSFAFNTASLAPGLYHYMVRGPAGIIGVGKLTIVR